VDVGVELRSRTLRALVMSVIIAVVLMLAMKSTIIITLVLLSSLPIILLAINRFMHHYMRRGWGRLLASTPTHDVYERGIYIKGNLDLFASWDEVILLDDEGTRLGLTDGTEIDVPQELANKVRNLARYR